MSRVLSCLAVKQPTAGRMPIELLMMIYAFNVASLPLDCRVDKGLRLEATRMSGVCNTWRFAAHCFAQFSSHIGIKTDRIAAGTPFLELLDAEFYRARQRPIHLHIDFGNRPLLEPALDYVRKAVRHPQVHHIHANIQSNSSLNAIFSTFTFGPSLRDFMLLWPDTATDNTLSAQNLELDFTNATKLEAFEFTSGWADPSITSSIRIRRDPLLLAGGLALKSLHVDNGLNVVDTVNMLRACTNLEHLVWSADGLGLDEFQWTPEFAAAVVEPCREKTFPPITLPCLKSCVVVGEVPLLILSQLVAPVLQKLTIDTSTIGSGFWEWEELRDPLDEPGEFPSLQRLSIQDCRAEDILRFRRFIAAHPALTSLEVPWEIDSDDVTSWVHDLKSLESVTVAVHPLEFLRGGRLAQELLEAKRQAGIAAESAATAAQASQRRSNQLSGVVARPKLFKLFLLGPWTADDVEDLDVEWTPTWAMAHVRSNQWADKLEAKFPVTDPYASVKCENDDRLAEEQFLLFHPDPMEDEDLFLDDEFDEEGAVMDVDEGH